MRSTPLLLLLLATVTSPAAAKPAACPDGRFILAPGTVFLADSPGGERQGISLSTGTLALDGSCGPATAKVKPGKRGTRVIARWKTCGDATKVKVKGSIAAPACDTFRGQVKVRKAKAQPFEAVRSACDDDYVDVLGGETCDLPADEPTMALLEAAAGAIAGGATDVALSEDGTLRFVRTATPSGGTDEIVRGAATLVRWVHDGDASTMRADHDGDGTAEIEIDATRAPARSAIVRRDFDDDGVVDRTVSTTQVGTDGVEVEITEAGQSPVGFSAPLEQELRAHGRVGTITGEGCTAEQLASAKFSLTVGTTGGFQCLRRLGLDSVAKELEGKIAKDDVVFRCGATTGCAQVDILDTLTGGFLPVPIGINLGSAFFTGAGACSNPAMVLFHEILHVGLADAHSPSLDRTTFEGLATDQVYSCTDLCFRPGKATKGECATCLGVDRCDVKCSTYADLPGDPDCGEGVHVERTSCPSTACTCCAKCPAGVQMVQTMEGTASGPVGHYLRVNLPPDLDGQVTCANWSAAACPGLGGGFLSCCQRQAGQPETTSFVGTMPFFPGGLCVCPPPPSAVVGTLVAQLVAPDNNVVQEDSKPITCP